MTMDKDTPGTQVLLTLPPRLASQFETLERRSPPAWFAISDPPGGRLGSGGGTAHLLDRAWQATGAGTSLTEWLEGSRKLVIHGGGQSRRLPAYAPLGKLLLPIPVFRWARGQRLDQTLIDLQLPEYQRVLDHSPAQYVTLVASGDVLLRFPRPLPKFPAVDVLGLGMWVPAEKARNFGVFFTFRDRPTELAMFLQKPTPARIRELADTYVPLVDTGVWLFSQRAVDLLLRRCGWSGNGFGPAGPQPYELYNQFGLALGATPTLADPEIGSLACAVVPMPRAEFHHFGTSRQMIESVSALQNADLDEMRLGRTGVRRNADVYLLSSQVEQPLTFDRNHTLWIENSRIPTSWRLAHEHVITGVPPNTWDLRLEPGVCLDFVPVGPTAFCVRCYGMDDGFSGPVEAAETRWLHRPAPDWFARRGFTPAAAGIPPQTDLQRAPLFPVFEPGGLDPRLIEWSFQAQPTESPALRQRWLDARRLSAEQLMEEASLERLYAQRDANTGAALLPMLADFRRSIFFRLDLESTAQRFARTDVPLPEPGLADDKPVEPLHPVHERMFASAVLRHRGQPGWEDLERDAFARLRELIVKETELLPARPVCSVVEDQIVWSRSPVRLDLAGGWTDTPPYCIEFGGHVINLAVDLNGQPPIQVFGKLCPRPEIVLRSIDLGVEERVTSYAELDAFARAGGEFSLAKAALALAGFLPRFNADRGRATLADQLHAFGGGIELSMLSAVPKGSGLGTSSILAATLLATLSELCGLGWDRFDLFHRTLATEQMLTTGGGWQDQAGGVFRGVKQIETGPGLAQKPNVRWLPQHLFEHEFANRTILLYYTGITRLAKNILQDIVRGIFLNSPAHLATIGEIGANASRAADAIQTCNYAALTDVIRRSWDLNRQLDAGTNPPPVQAILDSVGDWLAAAKLLGAGGGGFFVLCAKDETAASRLRRFLLDHPPNPRARFVDFQLSSTGLQTTRS
jgi:galactokinase/mevalonate kinase-like predicted kinase